MFWGASKMLRDRVASKREMIFWNVEEPSTIVALRLLPQAAVWVGKEGWTFKLQSQALCVALTQAGPPGSVAFCKMRNLGTESGQECGEDGRKVQGGNNMIKIHWLNFLNKKIEEKNEKLWYGGASFRPTLTLTFNSSPRKVVRMKWEIMKSPLKTYPLTLLEEHI